MAMARTGKKRALWQRALSLLMALSLCLPAPARAADKVQVTPYTSPVNGGRDYLVVLGSDNTLAVSSGCPEELAAALKRQKRAEACYSGDFALYYIADFKLHIRKYPPNPPDR